MKGLVRLYDWLLSFMDSISPRPLIVGIEQRHVHSAVIIRAVAPAVLLFVVLLLRRMIWEDTRASTRTECNAQ
jgi:hypothetical protein